MSKKLSLAAAVGLMAALAAGCITDYGGRYGEQTQGEAKLLGAGEFAFSGTGTDYDGTWAKTAKYNLKGFAQGEGTVFMYNYHNPVFAAFSREGTVDRDGDDIQGSAGALTVFPVTPAGQFRNGVTTVDNTPGLPCEFDDNIRQDFIGDEPGVYICYFFFVEEVDKDLALQESFASLDDLFGQIWSGALTGSFTVELTSVTLNGATVELVNPLSISVAHNGFRPAKVAVDFSAPGGPELIQAVLDNTDHLQPVAMGLGVAGGMTLNAPVWMSAAFNHDVLQAVLDGMAG